MKRIVITIILLTVMAEVVSAGTIVYRRRHDFWYSEWAKDEKGDSIMSFYLYPVVVYPRKRDMRQYWRLVNAVKKVYPIAKVARDEMAAMEDEMLRLPTKKAQKEYVKLVEKKIVKQYTPVLRHMTTTQGRVLVKLIDRETEYTAYQIVRQFRGGFVAGFWQGISRIFGQNLKSQYDKDGEDRMIEQIVYYYELGLLE